MAQPTSKTEFKEWCLRKLGKPVLEINVSDEQIDDRIEESLSYYWDYHFDGAEKVYLKHAVTANNKVDGYITIPENVIGVVNLFPVPGSNMSTGMFSAKYQFMLNNITEIARYDIVNYYMSMAHVQYMESIFVGQQPIRYNRHMNRLYIDTSWADINEGSFVIAECYQVVDPAIYTDVWKDRWLQNYATAKIKFQWGANLTKFSGMNLPGNVQFNGEFIYNEAKEEIAKLEEEMITSYSLPVTDMIG